MDLRKKLTYNQFRSKLKGSGYNMSQVAQIWKQYPEILSNNEFDKRISNSFNFDSIVARKNIILNNIKYIILDIETSGIGSFRPPIQKPIEIAFRVLSNNMELIYKYVSFIKTVKKIDWGNNMKCPYTVEEVNKKGKNLEIVVKELNKYFHSEVYIVGHNIMFDLGCINYHSKIKLKDFKFFDTMKRSINICNIRTIFNDSGDRLKFPRLSELAEFFEVNYKSSKLHGAYYDILITEKCFICILKFLKENVSTFEYEGFHKYIKIDSNEYNKRTDWFDNPEIFKNILNITNDDILKYSEHDLDRYRKNILNRTITNPETGKNITIGAGTFASLRRRNKIKTTTK